MEPFDLWRAHRHTEAIDACRLVLAVKPNDFATVDTLASALLAAGAYKDALPFFERMDRWERKKVVGHCGRRLDIACLHWCMDDWPRAITLMRGVAEGILDGSIGYGDFAGGVTQGLLLYYMGVTAKDTDAAAFALKYLRNRAKRSAIRSWPGPLARYYLDEIGFDDVVAAATKQRERELTAAIHIAQSDLLSRRHLCGALFHDGVRHRARGSEDACIGRMRECLALEDPLIELEWYLARYEIERAERLRVASRARS